MKNDKEYIIVDNNGKTCHLSNSCGSRDPITLKEATLENH